MEFGGFLVFCFFCVLGVFGLFWGVSCLCMGGVVFDKFIYGYVDKYIYGGLFIVMFLPLLLRVVFFNK